VRVVSLFSGCGGLDAGFSQAGFTIAAAYESDPRTVDVYNRNLDPVARQSLLNERSDIGNDIDVILATPPCQGFSTAGGYKPDDPRNQLLSVSIKLIISARPKVAVLENVAALGNAKNILTLQTAIGQLADNGFSVDFKVLEAERFGIPQRRRRMFIIARRQCRPFNMQAFGTGPAVNGLELALSGISVGTANHVPKRLPKGSKHDQIASRIRQGQKLCNVRIGGAAIPTWEIPEVFGAVGADERRLLQIVQRTRRVERLRSFGDADPVALESISRQFGRGPENEILSLISRNYLREIDGRYDLTNTFNGKYRRLKMDDVSPTVDTRFGDVRLFLHPVENRGLTVREAARIQGFDDNFVFDQDERMAFTQVGNAVPPPIGRAVAEFVRGLL